MHVHVGHFRRFGPGEPAEGTLTEMLGIEIQGDSEETILSVTVDPRADAYMIQIDRYESGEFMAVDASNECVVLHVRRTGGNASAPLPDNVRPWRPRSR
jgi:hypothetical protein